VFKRLIFKLLKKLGWLTVIYRESATATVGKNIEFRNWLFEESGIPKRECYTSISFLRGVDCNVDVLL
jgi:hypothetical protein